MVLRWTLLGVPNIFALLCPCLYMLLQPSPFSHVLETLLLLVLSQPLSWSVSRSAWSLMGQLQPRICYLATSHPDPHSAFDDISKVRHETWSRQLYCTDE